MARNTTAPKKGAPKKATPKKGTPKKGAPKKDALRKDAPKKRSPKKRAAKKGALEEDALEEDSPNDDGPKKCHLLSLPPELRNRIYQYVMRGDGGVIHVDLQKVWSDIELEPRLNLVFTCTQIYDETATMFLANNTFLFKARDRRIHHRMLENLSDWLNWVQDKELATIHRIVVCSDKPEGVLKYAWVQTQYTGMDAGFVMGERIDARVGEVFKDKHGFNAWKYESWGLQDGHHCNKSHYEFVFPAAEAKKLAKKLEKEEAKKRLESGVAE